MCDKQAEFVLYNEPASNELPTVDDAIGRYCTDCSVLVIKEKSPDPITVFCLNSISGFPCERESSP